MKSVKINFINECFEITMAGCGCVRLNAKPSLSDMNLMNTCQSSKSEINRSGINNSEAMLFREMENISTNSQLLKNAMLTDDRWNFDMKPSEENLMRAIKQISSDLQFLRNSISQPDVSNHQFSENPSNIGSLQHLYALVAEIREDINLMKNVIKFPNAGVPNRIPNANIVQFNVDDSISREQSPLKNPALNVSQLNVDQWPVRSTAREQPPIKNSDRNVGNLDIPSVICRKINENEVRLLKNHFGKHWQLLFKGDFESKMARASRISKFFFAHKAHETIQSCSPSAVRVFFNRGRIMIEETRNMEQKISKPLMNKLKSTMAAPKSQITATKQLRRPNAPVKQNSMKLNIGSNRRMQRDLMPGSHLKVRAINEREFIILKDELHGVWNQFYKITNENSYKRSVRVTRFLFNHDAAKIVGQVSPKCRRVYLSRNKLYVEESLGPEMYPDSKVTIYHHGLQKIPAIGCDYIEAPEAIRKFLFAKFPNFAAAASLNDAKKKNDFLNSQLKKLIGEKLLPNCLVQRQACFIDSKLHLKSAAHSTEVQSEPLQYRELKKLISRFPKLEQFILMNPGATDGEISLILAKLKLEQNFPKHIEFADGKFFNNSIQSESIDESFTSDLNWSIGAFDLITIALGDCFLQSALTNPDEFERISNAVFHINLRILNHEISYEEISKIEWGQNLIRNCAVLMFGLEILVDLGIIDDYKLLAEKLIDKCPKKSWLHVMVTNISKDINTESTARLINDRFNLKTKTLNDEYNSFIMKLLRNCKNPNKKGMKILGVLEQVKSLRENRNYKSFNMAFNIIESALRQSARAIVENHRQFTIAKYPPITFSDKTEEIIRKIFELLSIKPTKDISNSVNNDIEATDVFNTEEIEEIQESQATPDKCLSDIGIAIEKSRNIQSSSATNLQSEALNSPVFMKLRSFLKDKNLPNNQ